MQEEKKRLCELNFSAPADRMRWYFRLSQHDGSHDAIRAMPDPWGRLRRFEYGHSKEVAETTVRRACEKSWHKTSPTALPKPSDGAARDARTA